ncbi:MAG: class I SAM-dependent methyltransferase [Promethearchaeota archaeon]
MKKNIKQFYDEHRNFSDRRISEYYLSPGIRCKFDILRENIIILGEFFNGVDLGCSGNSFLYFLDNVKKKSFLDLVELPLRQYRLIPNSHPICSDISNLPYREKTFDFLSALSVLEHVKNDKQAISEISRIMKKEGIVIITVPHGMKYFTTQDKLIGHYRRYETSQIVDLFNKNDMKVMKILGVYGQLMRISDVQSLNPDKIEKNLMNLREKFESNIFFRMIWTVFVWIGAKIMKIDAKHQRLEKIMNMAFIFKKI